MNKPTFHHLVAGAILLAALHVTSAQAQSRTWVASNGNDTYPCSRTQPCKTFNGAFAKTTAGGEISVVDSGEYGSIQINKAITINGAETLASILAVSGTAIDIVAGATDRVIIRNLSINGTGGGNNNGINITGGNVTIDKCLIYGFKGNGVGIWVQASSAVNVDVRDTNITNTAYGFLASAQSAGSVVGSLDNVRINDAGIGVAAVSNNVFLTVRNSSLRFIYNIGIFADGSSIINVDRSELASSGTAVSAAGASSIVRLNANAMFDNNTGLAIFNGATIVTAGNNKGINNGVAPNGSMSKF